MRKYVDFWVKGKDYESSLELLRSLKRLGFSDAVIELGEGLLERVEDLKRVGEELGINVHRKLVIAPGSRKDLLRALRSNRGKFEVITVLCENLEVALVAARDSRVDSLVIPPKPKFRFDKGVAATIKNCVELPFSQYLSDKQAFLETALKLVEILGRRTELIVSSAASNSLELRGPRELASLPWVLGYPQEKALDSVSKTPRSILERNLLKLSKRYVVRGVVKLGEEGQEEVSGDSL